MRFLARRSAESMIGIHGGCSSSLPQLPEEKGGGVVGSKNEKYEEY